MERQMLRANLEKLNKVGALLECDREVDVTYEMGAVLSYYNNRLPMLFNKIKGFNIRSAGALFGDRDIMYYLLNMTRENRNYKFMEAIANPQPYKVVNTGPVKENIIRRGNIDIVKFLPINKFHEKDSSKYITAGVMVVKDPETGKYFTSIRRLQVNGKDNVSTLIASAKLTNDILELEKQGKPMEVAIVLGYDAEFLMASQISSSMYGIDKFELDSGLRGQPLELVQCESVDLLVPAHAEIILEGRIIPGKRIKEGPFGELMGYYGPSGPHPFMEIETITHRNNPIYQTAFPCVEEHLSNGLIREVELFNHLKNLVDVVDVNVTEGGGYRFNAFVSIRKKNKGDGKTAILGALGLNKDLKQVVIVDHDVDIYDLSDIEWAITTRTQAGLDFSIVEGALGSGLEASHLLRGVTDKLGIDATAPLGRLEKDFQRVLIPGFQNLDINKYFPNIK